MLEFRIRDDGNRLLATINQSGLSFNVTQTVRRKKEVFVLDIYEYHTSVFSNAYKTQDDAIRKANDWYNAYAQSGEEE